MKDAAEHPSWCFTGATHAVLVSVGTGMRLLHQGVCAPQANPATAFPMVLLPMLPGLPDPQGHCVFPPSWLGAAPFLTLAFPQLPLLPLGFKHPTRMKRVHLPEKKQNYLLQIFLSAPCWALPNFPQPSMNLAFKSPAFLEWRQQSKSTGLGTRKRLNFDTQQGVSL